MDFVAWGDEYLSTLSHKTGKEDPRGAGDINDAKKNVLISDY